MSNHKRILSIYVVCLVLTVVITLTLLGILVPDEFHTSKFALSCSMLVIAELLCFGYPISLLLRRITARSEFPFHLGTALIIGAYVIGIVILCVIAGTPMSLKYLVSAHLFLFLGFAITMGVYAVAGTSAKGMRVAGDVVRNSRQAIAESVNDAIDKLELLSDEKFQTFLGELKVVQKNIDSIGASASEAVLAMDANIDSKFDEMTASIDAGDADKAGSHLQRIKQLLKKRESLVKLGQ